jgi:hypothetical protein
MTDCHGSNSTDILEWPASFLGFWWRSRTGCIENRNYGKVLRGFFALKDLTIVKTSQTFSSAAASHEDRTFGTEHLISIVVISEEGADEEKVVVRLRR